MSLKHNKPTDISIHKARTKRMLDKKKYTQVMKAKISKLLRLKKGILTEKELDSIKCKRIPNKQRVGIHYTDLSFLEGVLKDDLHQGQVLIGTLGTLGESILGFHTTDVPLEYRNKIGQLSNDSFKKGEEFAFFNQEETINRILNDKDRILRLLRESKGNINDKYTLFGKDFLLPHESNRTNFIELEESIHGDMRHNAINMFKFLRYYEEQGNKALSESSLRFFAEKLSLLFPNTEYDSRPEVIVAKKKVLKKIIYSSEVKFALEKLIKEDSIRSHTDSITLNFPNGWAEMSLSDADRKSLIHLMDYYKGLKVGNSMHELKEIHLDDFLLVLRKLFQADIKSDETKIVRKHTKNVLGNLPKLLKLYNDKFVKNRSTGTSSRARFLFDFIKRTKSGKNMKYNFRDILLEFRHVFGINFLEKYMVYDSRKFVASVFNDVSTIKRLLDKKLSASEDVGKNLASEEIGYVLKYLRDYRAGNKSFLDNKKVVNMLNDIIAKLYARNKYYSMHGVRDRYKHNQVAPAMNVGLLYALESFATNPYSDIDRTRSGLLQDDSTIQEIKNNSKPVGLVAVNKIHLDQIKEKMFRNASSIKDIVPIYGAYGKLLWPK